MSLFQKLLKSRLVNNIVVLATASLALFLSLVIYIVVNDSYHLSAIDELIDEVELYSRKMQMNSELMELARARSRITLQIVDTNDIFEQDALNLDLDKFAAQFARIRLQLLQMPLQPEEVEKYLKFDTLVPVILPAQRRAVDLSMQGDPQKNLEARQIVYQAVLPGQNQIIDGLRELIDFEQHSIVRLTNNTDKTIRTIKTRNNLSVSIVLTTIFVLSVIVILRIRHIQTDLISSRNELEQRVEERTHEMVLARDEAEKANRTKSEFLANMSHEIRTPMNAIINLTQLALGQKIDAVARGYLEKLQFSGKSLLVIINEILDFSKIEAGKLDLEIITFDLKSQISELIDTLECVSGEKGLDLKFEFVNVSHRYINGDPLRLRQIIINLLNNALKFTEQGEVILRVEEINSDDQKAMFEFSIIDTGIGMTAEQQSVLFIPFQQADSSTTRKYGGTGLGLTICKRLVDLMGGDISVQSEPEVGSVFSFRIAFTFHQPADEKDTVDVSDISCQQQKLAGIKGAKILLAEDNEVNQLIGKALLEKIEVQVTVVNNGLEAISALRQEPFDLVLMDIQMPEMDGYEATREIRKHRQWSDLPIIAMTANAMAQDKEKSIQAGMNAHLPKPIDVEKLYELLVEWIKR